MSFLQEFSGMGSRPYPRDEERRRRVMVALAERGMSISSLAKTLCISKQYISFIVNGRRRSYKTEQSIAEYLDKPVDYLFPFREPEEIGEMRRVEAEAKGNVA